MQARNQWAKKTLRERLPSVFENLSNHPVGWAFLQGVKESKFFCAHLMKFAWAYVTSSIQ
jgi:hypothetical protein